MYGQLLFCICGIYLFFITWGILQERISTLAYVSPIDGTREKFTFFLVLNLTQHAVAALSAVIFSRVVGARIFNITLPLLKDYCLTAMSAAIASPLGYTSLKFINYPTMIIGKSCKLLPVMLMNVLIYRKKFAASKYLTVALITAGVSGFMLFEDKSSVKGSAASRPANSLFGLLILLVNLLLDGTTNSLQDRIFMRHKVRSHHMMFFMNCISAVFLLAYLVLWPRTHELAQAAAFLKRYPAALFDIGTFALCGAMGQNFVYYTLEKFGSLSLVTVTVTRKLFTILISLFYFKHTLNAKQWLSIALVFVALIAESCGKKFGSSGGVVKPAKNAAPTKKAPSKAEERLPFSSPSLSSLRVAAASDGGDSSSFSSEETTVMPSRAPKPASKLKTH